jgi:hypothetical protein
MSLWVNSQNSWSNGQTIEAKSAFLPLWSIGEDGWNWKKGKWGKEGGGRKFESIQLQIIFLDEQKVGKGFWGWGNRFYDYFEFLGVC